jgi:hypothetical protein
VREVDEVPKGSGRSSNQSRSEENERKKLEPTFKSNHLFELDLDPRPKIVSIPSISAPFYHEF